MSGVGYRVSSAQGPETTRHGAELHPITAKHYLTLPKYAQPENAGRFNAGLAR